MGSIIKLSNYQIIKLILLMASTSPAFAADVKIEQIKANGYEFVCRTIGDPTAKVAVILLHGFPETSQMWEETMEHLNKKGYYCLAPNMRGYSPNARPKGLRNYAIQDIAKDIVEIAKAKGIENFHLIGHDWGSAIGWAIVGLYPDKVASWIPMSVPHLTALAHAVKEDSAQKKMSQYAKVFQLRWLPELVLKGKDFARLKKECWYLSGPRQLEDYKAVFSQKRAMTACLNYYRKNWNKMLKISETLNIAEVRIPTTMIWGKKDTALGRKAVEDTAPFMKGNYTLVELEASHWLIQDKKMDVWDAMNTHFWSLQLLDF